MYAENEKTSLVVPLMTAGQRLGAIHFGSDLKQAFGFTEFRPLIRRMANLAAVAIQNTRLLEDALNLRQFNESVVQSIQQGIVVLDKSGHIISINTFMRNRYGWESSAIGQDLFEYRPDMGNLLLTSVRRTLDNGRPQEHLNIEYDLGSESLTCNILYLPAGYGWQCARCGSVVGGFDRACPA